MSRFFILILIIFNDSSQAERRFGVKPGESVTIPCSYDIKYIQHKKYWCCGEIFRSCEIQAYANDTKGKVSVTDHPVERFFTLTMDNLQTEDSRLCWCAVEIYLRFDISEAFRITVKSDTDLSVMESRVSGEEGGSVTVQCLCSATYLNAKKQWCRFRDKYCITVTKTEKILNLAVQLSNNGRRFSVQMSGLNKSDAGWYWCSADKLQVPVYISVSDPPPVVKAVTEAITTMSTRVTRTTGIHVENNLAGQTLIHWYLLAFFLLLVILVIITCLLRKKCSNQNRTKEGSDDTTVHAPTSASEASIIYSTVTVSKPKGKRQPTFTDEDSIIYSTVAKAKPKVSSNSDADETSWFAEIDLLFVCGASGISTGSDVHSQHFRQSQSENEQITPHSHHRFTLQSHGCHSSPYSLLYFSLLSIFYLTYGI